MRRALVIVLAAGALLGFAAPAGALYYGTGATVVSASLQRQELADDRTLSADVSTDGRYVAFDTRAANFFADDDPDPTFTGKDGGTVPTDRQGGIFRRDLTTGAVELVADGDIVAESDGTPLALGAHNPSVSGDGRYVAFSTAQRLVPQDSDDPRDIDVYVRDMSRPLCRPLPGCSGNPYTLVSALDGTDVPTTYAPPFESQPAGSDGSTVWPGTSISDDGRRVLFRTVVSSDAPGGPDATPGVPSNGAGQLLLRDLDTQRTLLVTRSRTTANPPSAPVGGARGPASLSADGSTVAWAGAGAPEQTRFQPGEADDDGIAFYLWRRLSGPATFGEARRITGATDVDDPDCAPGDPVDFNDQASTGPCYGPLATYESERGPLVNVALSSDGFTAAFLTASGRRPGPVFGGGVDLFLTSMRPGVSRKQGTTELTRDGVGDPTTGADIEGVAMSPDASVLAVTSARTQFLLPALRLLGATRARPVHRDLYAIDVGARTIQRALVSLGGGDPNGDVDAAASVSEQGRSIAFVSDASNLFRGDANDRADAFVVHDQPVPVEAELAPEPPPVDPPQAVGDFLPAPPTLSVLVRKGKRTGEMLLEIRPPSAGRLAATVTARLPGRDGKRKASTPVTTLVKRGGRARARERVRMVIALRKPAQISLLKRLRSLTTSAQVVFTPDVRGARPLQRRVTVKFVVIKHKSKHKHKSKSGKKRSRKAPAKRTTGRR